MKLELKHLAPYLPYGLKSVDYFEGNKLIRDVTLYSVVNFFDFTTNAKPMFRPLSDLTNEIEHNGEKFIPIKEIREVLIHNWCVAYVDALEVLEQNPEKVLMIPYEIFQLLIKWRFDVFGLIEKGLAVDLNTLK